jgi:hypothetical protein
MSSKKFVKNLIAHLCFGIAAEEKDVPLVIAASDLYLGVLDKWDIFLLRHLKDSNLKFQ